ncbi:hypothetical protein BRL93_24640 [Xanthomonas oryzae pv. oryzae]|nr:hypothetical protein BRL93_24640 [Xanthomonas oryzae pv. oryzae]UWZ69792.1 hypothetical protein BHL62_16410 [Xanthomonas oryzae pv. oryzae]
MVGTLLWLSHLEACPMRAPSSTAWPTKCLILQEEMWGNLRVGMVTLHWGQTGAGGRFWILQAS